jgi:hypothetical protein
MSTEINEILRVLRLTFFLVILVYELSIVFNLFQDSLRQLNVHFISRVVFHAFDQILS